MIWNKHYSLKDAHAFLSPSQYAWLNYTEDKLVERYKNLQAAQRGTEIHDFAAKAIKHKIAMPDDDITIDSYINDAIKHRMDPEVLLYYSKWCYGTADSISCRIEPKIDKNKKVLRISDLKTGSNPAKMDQLHVYAALFCLEYDELPSDLVMILRIYQSNYVTEDNPTSEIIVPIMDRIKRFDKIIESLQEGALS
jgi:hypothetical protein